MGDKHLAMTEIMTKRISRAHRQGYTSGYTRTEDHDK